MLASSNLNIIKEICEIILNIYYKHITLSTTALKALKKHMCVDDTSEQEEVSRTQETITHKEYRLIH